MRKALGKAQDQQTRFDLSFYSAISSLARRWITIEPRTEYRQMTNIYLCSRIEIVKEMGAGE